MYHNAVLLKEAVEGLNMKKNGTYVDVTFGGGGHSREILKNLDASGSLYAFDRDLDALQNTIKDSRFHLFNENFKHIQRSLNGLGVFQVDGILADFGISSHQIDVSDRGFSTRTNAEIDMRMNKTEAISATYILNHYSEAQLTSVFKTFGELKNARSIAKILIKRRNEQDIKTVEDLKLALQKIQPRGREHKFLAQVFQAIRIEVNAELEAIEAFLLQTPNIVCRGGRISIISYHSLEDRLVKRFIRDGKFEGSAPVDFYGNRLTPFTSIGKLITPSEEEVTLNTRSRSAKLRIAERL